MTAQLAQPLKPTTDQRIVLQGTWEKFKLIQQASAESAGVRLAYDNGTIEILMPGREHEVFSHIIGYLLTTFLLEQGIQFQPTGSMTQEVEGVASAQADQSYCIGESKQIPDLSIAIVFTSGSNKLARYQALGVPEVWFWQDGVLNLYHLQDVGYERIKRSELPRLNQLDIDLLQCCVTTFEYKPMNSD